MLFLKLLVLTLLYSNFSGDELLKIGFLAKHFAEHQSVNPHTGIIEFLSMHYWGKDLNDHDQQKDNQLPFKNVHSFRSVVLFHPPVRNFSTEVTCYTLPLDFYYLSESFPRFCPNKLLRPPRA
jgi:hypothetical protein